MLVAEQFIQKLATEYGKHPVHTDGQLVIRTESFDDYFPCMKQGCKLQHVINWFNLFIDYHNKGDDCLS